MPVTPSSIRDMAERYTAAWSSGNPEAVASFYDEEGHISINDGEAISGRAAIAAMAADFYAQFPDLELRLDDIRPAENNAVFMWTLEGTHSETKNHVKVQGWEEWVLSDNVLVSVSRGRFDAADFDRQIAGS